MKRNKKDFVSWSEHKSIMDVLKQLYGNKEVKDDTDTSTERESRATGVSDVVAIPPKAE